MNSLPHFGVSKELSHDEFLRRLRCAKDQEIAELRRSLFEDAKVNDLVHMDSQLVTRRKVGGGKSVVDKHMEDVWLLVRSIQEENCVPRVLLKNGKRSKEEFEQSRACSNDSTLCSKSSHRAADHFSSPVDPCQCGTSVPLAASISTNYKLLDTDVNINNNNNNNNLNPLSGPSVTPVDSNLSATNSCSKSRVISGSESVFCSSVISDINSLKTNVSSLQQEVRQLRQKISDCQRSAAPLVLNKSCFLYVRLSLIDLSSVGTSLLESVLSCDVQRYWFVGKHQHPVLKVKILESNLATALTCGNQNGHYVSVWHKDTQRHGDRSCCGGLPLVPFGPGGGWPQRLSSVSNYSREHKARSINILSWNSRGLSSSVPYIQSLLCGKPAVLVLSEHWLWPYELSRLNDICDDYEVSGKADLRLTETSYGGRGCGGVAMLWHKSIGAIPVSDIISDRICAIRFGDPADNRLTISVIGVYLPCSDQGIDCYRDHLCELERVISDSVHLGPVIIIGDFNAHLGSLGGARGKGDPNLQGILLYDIMNRHSLCAISQCDWATGPPYTYISGNSMTTVDYIIATMDATSMVSSCKTLPMADLNTSDHLPLIAELAIECLVETQSGGDLTLCFDWDQAIKSGEINEYHRSVTQQLSELISHASFDGLEDIEAAICRFTDILKDAAAKTLPVKSYKKPHKWKDTILSTLCAQSRAARQIWKENGCPKEGPLYNEKGRLRREVKKRLRYCAAQAENRRLLRRDKMFASSHPHRFKLLGHRKKTCSRLKVNDTIITDTPGLLETWADHFSSLAQSKISDNHGLAVLASDIESLVTSSMDNEEYILDVPFTVEEVENAIKRLKRKKAPGADDLLL